MLQSDASRSGFMTAGPRRAESGPGERSGTPSGKWKAVSVWNADCCTSAGFRQDYSVYWLKMRVLERETFFPLDACPQSSGQLPAGLQSV
ncbi:hypothetical protein Q8A67_025779 [Cirrhinus molitorella]|uniref:Uncharacterized protein n=1 Tax=Cirrhinus molitorella TaxID=172907 RepID=A0AA88NV71_9TELE|nr:hypothetical protein Q8A67_025779 [Cirrhinus molitorella]